MKKIIKSSLTLICILGLIILCDAQNSETQSLIEIEVPENFRSQEYGLKKSNTNYIEKSQFVKEINGVVSILFDKKGQVVKILAPQSIDYKALTSQDNRNSSGCDCPTYENIFGDETVSLVCMTGCLIDGIISWFK